MSPVSSALPSSTHTTLAKIDRRSVITSPITPASLKAGTTIQTSDNSLGISSPQRTRGTRRSTARTRKRGQVHANTHQRTAQQRDLRPGLQRQRQQQQQQRRHRRAYPAQRVGAVQRGGDG